MTGMARERRLAEIWSYARARHLRLSDLATRIISGDFDTADIPVPAMVRSEDRRR